MWQRRSRKPRVTRRTAPPSRRFETRSRSATSTSFSTRQRSTSCTTPTTVVRGLSRRLFRRSSPRRRVSTCSSRCERIPWRSSIASPGACRDSSRTHSDSIGSTVRPRGPRSWGLPIATRELAGVRVEIEPELVERVLDEVGAGRIETALAGRGSIEGVEDTARIEAPYLQLVMQRLWEEERKAGSSILRAVHVREPGRRAAHRRGALRERHGRLVARSEGHRRTALRPSRHAVGHEDRPRAVGSRRLRRASRSTSFGRYSRSSPIEGSCGHSTRAAPSATRSSTTSSRSPWSPGARVTRPSGSSNGSRRHPTDDIGNCSRSSSWAPSCSR